MASTYIKFGRTPLMFAVFGDFPECAEALLKGGARLAKCDRSGRTALHWAAHHGHVASLKVLLHYTKKQNFDWRNFRDDGGVTILHLATRHPRAKCLPAVMKHFAIFGPQDLNVQDENKRTPLHWSASQGSIGYVRLLLKLGATSDLIDVEGKTPLHWAASSGTHSNGLSNDSKKLSILQVDPLRTLQALLAVAPNTINWQDYEGRTPLHLAVADSPDELVRDLLKSTRVQVNALDFNYRTALHWAALLGRTSTCAMLLEHGAKYQCQDANGATPLHYAVQAEMIGTVESLMKRPDVLDLPDLRGHTALMWASIEGKASASIMIAALCRHGSNHAEADLNGHTALHLAVINGHVDVVEALLNLGSGIDSRDKDGHTPLALAASFGRAKEAKLLISRRKSSMQVEMNLKGQSPLHLACEGGHTELAAIILRSWPDLVNVKDTFGRTPMILASYGGYIECITLLLNEGGTLDENDHEFMSPLHWAVVRGHLDAVRLLIMKDAPLNNIAYRKNLNPATPLDTALSLERQEIVQCLVAAGAKTLAKLQSISATRNVIAVLL